MTERSPARTVSLHVTAARVALIPVLLLAETVSVVVCAIVLMSVVAADVADGVIARARGEETFYRRLLDSGLDKLTIHSALGFAVYQHPVAVFFYVPLLGRDVAVMRYGLRSLRRRRLLIVGGRWHSLASIVDGIFGLAILGGSSHAVVIAGAGALGINLALGCDYVGGYMASRNLPVASCVTYSVLGLSGIDMLLARLRHAFGATHRQTRAIRSS